MLGAGEPGPGGAGLSTQHIVLFAGARIARYFIERDLFDEYRLRVK